jgi:Xaa-Pro dipeptidase
VNRGQQGRLELDDHKTARDSADAPYAPFSVSEYAARVAAVRADMQERELDALLVSSPENIFYLTGLSHQGHFAFTALVLKAEGECLLVARAMERHTLAAQVPNCEHVPFDDGEEPADAVARAIFANGLGHSRLGVEKHTMSFPIHVWEGVLDRTPRVRWEDGSELVDDARSIKSSAEIDYIRQAAVISDYAIQSGIGVAGVGVNEREVATEVYRSMLARGSEYPGGAPLIRTSDLLLHEHETWRDRVLRAGDGLFLELSGCVHRYHAPLTRMVYVGHAPDAVDAAAEIVLAGLEAVRDALRPGALAREVYAAWQAVVDEALGHRDYRRHHCGYMIGIGFPPSFWVGGSMVKGLRPGSELTIREGMVFHLLPWLLGQGPADYVVSDTVLVTSTGPAELLTSVARTPMVVE